MANPALNNQIFENQSFIAENNVMTINGTMLKSMFLLLLVFISGAYSWSLYTTGNMPLVQAFTMGGFIAGFILSMIIIFARKTAPFLSPIYAIAEGLALGGISAMFNASMPGIVFQAVVGSLAVMFVMLALYMSKVISVTDKLRSVIIASTGAIAIVYLISFILSFFGKSVPFINDATPIGIGISIFVIIVAAFNLLLDFDIIERGAASLAPKYFEWYCSFGLLVTLVWLYIEVLKLLSKLQRR